MCDRFTQKYSWSDIHAFLSVIGAPRKLRPRYNVSPTTNIDVVRLNTEGQRELVHGVRWGLLPCLIYISNGRAKWRDKNKFSGGVLCSPEISAQTRSARTRKL